jgi:hypothetical protein
MRIVPQRLRVSALGLVLLTVLSGCVASGGGYVGGVYEPSGYDYGGWGRGYHVAPPRRGERRPERPSPPAYKPAPRSRPTPSIPARPRGR